LKNLKERYQQIRQRTESLCSPLEIEDYIVQSMPDVSPAKWHLAHTSWFFETFVLEKYLPDYSPFHSLYGRLFNSYYNLVGPQWERSRRGQLSRPTVSEIYDYRSRIDKSIETLFERYGGDKFDEFLSIMLLGLNHEQQHQELLVTDIKYNFSINPLRPVLMNRKDSFRESEVDLQWIEFPGGTYQIGHVGSGFCFDNELSQHQVHIQDFKLANRLITCKEYLEFMDDGGYQTPEIWLADGWDLAQQSNWEAPLYWEKVDNEWHLKSLSGFRKIRDQEPVCHISHYEADAFATWANRRLPTEFEWEVAAKSSLAQQPVEFENDCFHPQPARSQPDRLLQLLSDTWEWTSSAYLPYPGFSTSPGAVGEYNGKFMSGQMVLRGGSVATPLGHTRTTYRNFFQPEKRWQFTGVRLADNA
jgi:ergothioneine biosynthesis protein EgtB